MAMASAGSPDARSIAQCRESTQIESRYAHHPPPILCPDTDDSISGKIILAKALYNGIGLARENCQLQLELSLFLFGKRKKKIRLISIIFKTKYVTRFLIFKINLRVDNGWVDYFIALSWNTID